MKKKNTSPEKFFEPTGGVIEFHSSENKLRWSESFLHSTFTAGRKAKI